MIQQSCDVGLRDNATFIAYILVDLTVESVLSLLQLSLEEHVVKRSPQVSACKSDAYFTYLPREAFRGALIILQGILLTSVNNEINDYTHTTTIYHCK